MIHDVEITQYFSVFCQMYQEIFCVLVKFPFESPMYLKQLANGSNSYFCSSLFHLFLQVIVIVLSDPEICMYCPS